MYRHLFAFFVDGTLCTRLHKTSGAGAPRLRRRIRRSAMASAFLALI